MNPYAKIMKSKLNKQFASLRKKNPAGKKLSKTQRREAFRKAAAEAKMQYRRSHKGSRKAESYDAVESSKRKRGSKAKRVSSKKSTSKKQRMSKESSSWFKWSESYAGAPGAVGSQKVESKKRRKASKSHSRKKRHSRKRSAKYTAPVVAGSQKAQKKRAGSYAADPSQKMSLEYLLKSF